MKHRYLVEVLQDLDGQIILTHQSSVFVATYADARATLAMAVDIAVKQLDLLPYVNSCVVQPVGDNAVQLTWVYTNGDLFVRTVDLVRIGDVP